MNKLMDSVFFKKIKPIALLTLIPAFFTFVFGAALCQTYVEHIPIGILDLDQSSVSRSVIDMVEDSEGLDVASYAESLSELEEMLMRGEVYGGLIFPDDFGKKLRRFESPQVMVLVDFSNILIGNNITAYASAVFNTMNAGLSMNILEAGQIVPYVAEQSVTTLSFTERMLYDPRSSYFLYLYTIILTVLIQQLYLSVTAPIFVEEKQRLRKLIPIGDEQYLKKIDVRQLGKKIMLYVGCSLIGSFAALMMAHYFFSYPVNSNPLLMILLQIIFLVSLTAISMIFGAIVDDVAHCGQLIMLLSIPTILFSGYAWPEFMMPPWMAAVVHGIWPIIYFINPLRIIHIKGAGLSEISSYVAGGLIFAAVWSLVALVLYMRKCLAANDKLTGYSHSALKPKWFKTFFSRF